MRYIIIILFFVINSMILSQVELSRPDENTQLVASFYIDYTCNKSQLPGKTRFDVFLQVPYRSIQFIKRDSIFFGTYNVTLTFYDSDKSNILFEKMWQEQVKTANFRQTTSQNNYNISYKNFDLTPGKYVLKCYIEDNNSEKKSEKTFPITIRKINDTLGISDILLISDIIHNSDVENIVPNAARIITNKTKNLQLTYEIYSSTNRNVFVNYLIKDNDDNKIFETKDTLTIKEGTNPIYYTINYQNFIIGKYELEVSLQNLENKTISSVTKTINSRIFGLPSTIVNLNKAIEQMIYIASSKEIDEIKNSKTYQEKLDKFMAFWNSKKPNKNSDENPILNEYYRRIDYANKNFRGIGEGWRTDMGMVYVTFGPPSNVERHAFEMDSKPYEIWEYYEQNRYFVFVDNTGFGDYYLVNPDYSRWPGYRQ
ncbi:GWxTD domain-containing protein [Melioribacteraceae bacterium 4301-Me]|uniref:GWxTD domain-containing protein n=1 Tax=Pyranulibacter aquaticus TaxID=3163344 RepID=UPI00359646E0